jgi:peptide/nickel transport system permease protein
MTVEAIAPTAEVSQHTPPSPPAVGGHFFKRLLRSWSGGLFVAFLALIVLAAAAAEWIAPYGPLQNDLLHTLEGPSSAHLLGTDTLGRDVLSRLLFGAQPTFVGVAEAAVVAVLIGVPIGILAGYFGGLLDSIIGRILDIGLAIPGIVVLLMALTVFGNSQSAAMIVLGVLFAPGLARVARGATLSTKHELYVAAARVSGLGNLRIMTRHVLPRIANPVIVRTALLTATALLVQTGLSFLGLGVQPPNPTWGSMVAEGATVLQQQAWLIVPSGLIIAFTVLAFMQLGDAIRDTAERGRSSTNGNLSTRRKQSQAALASCAAHDAPPTPVRDAILTVTDMSIELPLKAGWTTVVDNVSFSVAPGETLALVGESGCGKTVTALSVLGLVPGGGRISAGSCTFEGTELANASDGQLQSIRGKKIGFISQEPMVSLDPSFTVGSQLIELIRKHDGGTRAAARKRMLELLEMTGLPEPATVARRYPHQISGGMAQRVVIARALAGRPSLLIADEPTTALDATVQAGILELLRSLQREIGMAMILVTHDWGVVADIADRAVVMYAGQAVEYATVREIFEQPVHPYTWGLLQADPHLASEGERIRTIEGTVPPPTNWPVGCRFAARCPFVTDACTESPISLLQTIDDRRTRCIHSDVLVKAGIR